MGGSARHRKPVGKPGLYQQLHLHRPITAQRYRLYRLMQADQDGISACTSVLSVEGIDPGFDIFPSPAVNNFTIARSRLSLEILLYDRYDKESLPVTYTLSETRLSLTAANAIRKLYDNRSFRWNKNIQPLIYKDQTYFESKEEA